MLITTHIAATLILGKYLNLSGLGWLMAFLGGVAIDIDHVLLNFKYLPNFKLFFKKASDTSGQVNQHWWTQEPIFGAVVGAVIGVLCSIIMAVQWWLFLLFQFLHISLDSLMKFEHQPLIPFSRKKYFGPLASGTKIELIISLVALGVMIF